MMVESKIIKKDILTDIHKWYSDYIKDIQHEEDTIFNSSYLPEVEAEIDKLAKREEYSKSFVRLLKAVVPFLFLGKTAENKFDLQKSRQSLNDFKHSHEIYDEEIGEIDNLLTSFAEINQHSHESVKILSDAVNSFAGRKRFFRKTEAFRLNSTEEQPIPAARWERQRLELLESLQFFSVEGKKKYYDRWLNNITKQRRQFEKANRRKIRKVTGKDFGRGVDTLYRANYRNHINLSSIADGKANMMISINTIIVSIIVTLSGAGFTLSGNYILNNLRYTIPIFILLIGCLSSVVFAILSATPKVTSKKLDRKEVEENKVSLMYFGNFLRIKPSEFVAHLSELKKDQQALYDSMSVDLYQLGRVLDKKYRLLNFSYRIFMLSLILSVASFVAIFIYTNR